MSLLIGPFPNGLPIGPHSSLLGPSVSPTKILLRYLGSFRLPLPPCGAGLPVSPRSCPGDGRANSLAKAGETLPVAHDVPCLLAPTIAKIRHNHYSLWRRTLSYGSLRFPRGNWPFPVLSAVGCLGIFCPLAYAG